MRKIFLNILKASLVNPLKFFQSAYIQSFMIIQPVNFETDGRQDMCDSCPDITVHDGKLVWKTRIVGEIISAPTITDEGVYFATLDGTLFCCERRSGDIRWQRACSATSSPVVVNGECYFSQREEVKGQATGAVEPTDSGVQVQQMELCASSDSRSGAESRKFDSTRRRADYLDHRKRSASSGKLRANR